MEHFLSDNLVTLRQQAMQIAQAIEPHSDKVDQECLWPSHTFKALRKQGLLGLHVPKRLGGHEEGLLALALVTEALGRVCPSSAICFGMHCVGTAVIAAKATPRQEKTILTAIAAGKHITTLAASEPGIGSQFFFPQTTATRERSEYVIRGRKSFVTNGGYANSYVVSTVSTCLPRDSPGEFSCFLVPGTSKGLEWSSPWKGLGMRGNSARTVSLNDVRVSAGQLLGAEGDEIWYVFHVIAPYFLMAMAGTYLGVAEAALSIAVEHAKHRSFTTGARLSEMPGIQKQLGTMWASVEKLKCLIYNAGTLGDLGSSEALPEILASKAEAAVVAVQVTNDAMSICGGTAYGENSRLARLLRDARAAPVMTPTTDMLYEWIGKVCLDVPIL